MSDKKSKEKPKDKSDEEGEAQPKVKGPSIPRSVKITVGSFALVPIVFIMLFGGEPESPEDPRGDHADSAHAYSLHGEPWIPLEPKTAGQLRVEGLLRRLDEAHAALERLAKAETDQKTLERWNRWAQDTHEIGEQHDERVREREARWRRQGRTGHPPVSWQPLPEPGWPQPPKGKPPRSWDPAVGRAASSEGR